LRLKRTTFVEKLKRMGMEPEVADSDADISPPAQS